MYYSLYGNPDSLYETLSHGIKTNISDNNRMIIKIIIKIVRIIIIKTIIIMSE
jgi:hypothetical protein